MLPYYGLYLHFVIANNHSFSFDSIAGTKEEKDHDMASQ